METRTAFLSLLMLCLGLLAGMPGVAHAGGILSVTSTVAGAELWIDGTKVGTVPYRGEVAAGSHSVRVVADFHDPFVRRIDVRQGRPTKVMARLLSGEGTVEFAAEPRGTTLVINGRDRWPLPVRLSDLRPGSYSYVMSAPGHEPIAGDFQFRKGQNIYIYRRLVDTRGLLVIATRPPGAALTVDEQEVGSSPLDVTGLSPTEHSVRIQLAGHADVFRTVDMSDGKKAELRTRLQEKGAHLVVRTGLETADVYLEGTLIGTGKKVNLPSLARGRLTLEVRAPDHRPARTRVRVPSGGRILYKAELMPTDGDAPSALLFRPPLTKRWTFWAALTAGAGGVGATSALIWQASQPVDVPTGDIIMTTP